MLILLILFLIWLVVVLFSRLSLIRIQTHWHAKQTVITQFSTPNNLSPAEFGYIFDRKFGRNEMLGTIVKLYQQNVLALKIADDLSGEIEITAQRHRPKNSQLDDCEAVLISHITYSEGGLRKWSEMNSIFSREAGARWQYERAVVSQLIDKGYLTERAKSEPFVDRFIKSVLGFAITWGIFFTVLGNQLLGASTYERVDSFVSMLLLTPLFVLVWLGIYVYLSVLTHEIRLSAGLPRFATDKLRAEWRDVVGFREYLRVVEWHRLRSQPDIKNKVLAYCLAAGFRVDIKRAMRA